MKKSELKTGMIVVLQDGQRTERAMVLLGACWDSGGRDVLIGETWMPLSSFHEDLTKEYGLSVIAVYAPRSNRAASEYRQRETFEIEDYSLLWEAPDAATKREKAEKVAKLKAAIREADIELDKLLQDLETLQREG